MAFSDAYQMVWGSDFTAAALPGTHIRFGARMDITEVSQDEITVRIRIGYWTDKDSEAKAGEWWTADLSGNGTTFLYESDNAGGSGVKSEAQQSALLDEMTVKLPRRASSYTVTLLIHGAMWGASVSSANGRAPRLSLVVPAGWNDAWNLAWGRWFIPPAHPGNRMRVGVHAWVQETTEEAVTIRCRVAYWSDKPSRLGSGETWTITLSHGKKRLKQISGRGDMVSPPITSDASIAYIEDFTVTAPRLGSSYEAALAVYGSFWGQYYDSSNLSPVSRVTVPAIEITRPDPPTGLKVTLDGMTASLQWAEASDVDAGKPWDLIRIYRSTGIGTPQLVATLKSSLTWKDASLTAAQRYGYSLRSVNSAGESVSTAEVEVYTKPTAVLALTVTRMSDTSIMIAWSDNNVYTSSYSIERRAEGGGWSALDTVEKVGRENSFLDDDVPEADVRYRVKASGVGGVSPWAESQLVRYVCTPEPPAVMGIAAGSIVSTSSAREIEWVVNHPDASSQSSAEVRIDDEIIPIRGDVSRYILVGIIDGDHVLSVRTKGASDNWGAWSADISFTAVTPPAVELLFPMDDSTITVMPIDARWSAFSNYGISRTSLTIERVDGGTAIELPIVGGESYRIDAGVADLRDDGTYRLMVSVVDGFGYRSTDSCVFRVRFVAPALPQAQIRNDEDALCVYIWCTETQETEVSCPKAGSFQAGTSLLTASQALKWRMQDCAETDHFEVWRQDADGVLERIARDVHAEQMVTDATPPLNKAYRYRIDAISPDGERSSRWLENTLNSHDRIALNYGKEQEGLATLIYDLDAGAASGRGGSAYYFPGVEATGSWDGAEMPVWYPNAHGEGGYELSGSVMSLDEAMRWRDAFRCGGVALYRTLFGERAYVAISGSVDVSHSDGRQWNITATLVEVAHG